MAGPSIRLCLFCSGAILPDMKRSLAGVACVLLATGLAAPGLAWGPKGHRMAARVATRALPGDVPAFFREASERLAYQCPEPDRWRGPNQPALTATTAPDHGMRLELLRGIQLPLTRYEFLVLAAERGILPRDKFDVRNLGTAFYAIVEEAERLTAEFRLWREAHEAAVPDAVAPRQIEANVLWSAGVLAHYITDTSQPLHTSVHTNGWAAGFPNPKGYVGERIHGRFESEYVDRAVEEEDVVSRMTPLRALGDWRAEAEAHLRRSHEFVEQVYALDQRGAFGSGQEPKEAQAFTAARLAYGASQLRDAWHAAWRKSGEQLLDQPVQYRGASGRSALDLLRGLKRVETRDYDFGKLVTAIGDRRNGDDGRYWHYYVNGKLATQAADRYLTSDGERIEWRFTRR